MQASAAPPIPGLPFRRPDLVVRPLGDGGNHVVKDPRTGAYFHIGADEYFLLMQLDGERDAATVRRAFGELFAEPLSDEDLEAFLAIARQNGLLEERGGEGEKGRRGEERTRGFSPASTPPLP